MVVKEYIWILLGINKIVTQLNEKFRNSLEGERQCLKNLSWSWRLGKGLRK